LYLANHLHLLFSFSKTQSVPFLVVRYNFFLSLFVPMSNKYNVMCNVILCFKRNSLMDIFFFKIQGLKEHEITSKIKNKENNFI